MLPLKAKDESQRDSVVGEQTNEQVWHLLR